MQPADTSGLSVGSGNIGHRSDGLAEKYCSLASDGAQVAKAREAAMLFNAAEMSLNDEDSSNALMKANQALSLFREVGDHDAEADSFRLILSAFAEGQPQNAAGLEEVLNKASKELESFKAKGLKRGEAAMLVSISEISHAHFGSQKREEAILAATRAREIFKDLRDAKMEGVALLALANAHLTQSAKHDSRKGFEHAFKAAEDALAVFRQVKNDRNGEGKALHCMAIAFSHMESMEEAVRYGRQALNAWRDLGLKQFEGMELRCLADWLLSDNKPEESLKLGEAALKIFEEVGDSKGWEAAALSSVVRATLKLKNTDQAAALVKDGVRSFASRADEAGEVAAQALAIEVQLAIDDYVEAIVAAEKCLDSVRSISKRTDTDRKFEASILHNTAQIQVAEEDYAKALESCQSALAIARDLGDKHQEGLILNTACTAQVGLKAFRDAVKAAVASRDIFRKRGHKRGHAYSSLTACHAYAARGETNRAISMAKEASKIFSEEKHRKGEADALAMLAEVWLARGSWSRALSCAKNARFLNKSLGDDVRELEVLFLVAKANFWIAHDEGSAPKKVGEKLSPAWEAALQAALESLSMSRKLGIEASLVSALFAVGQVYVVTRNPAEAAKVIQEATPIAQRLEDHRAEAHLEVLFAQMQVMIGKDDKAAEPAKKALEIFKETLNDKDGEDIVNELIRYIEGGDGGVGASQQQEGEEASQTALAEYQGPTLEDLVATITDVALSLMGVDDLEGDTPLMDAGLDSLASVEFQNNLQKEFAGVQMPATLVFDYPSVNAMSEFIYGGLREAAGFKAVAD